MKKAIAVVVLAGAVLAALLYRPSIPLETLKEKYANEYSKFIHLGDQDIHYRVRGQGMPLLLIHGTSSSLHTWEPWTDVLAGSFTVYSVDLPGCGLTGPHPDDDYSIAMYLDFLTGFTRALGLDSFYMAGNSLGGHIVWEYARISPAVKKAILVDPSGFYEEDRDVPLVFRLGRKKVFGAIVESLNVRPLISKSLREVYYDDDKITPELLQRYSDLIRREGNRKAFIKKVATVELSPESELQEVTCPVLIQWGRNDTWIPLSLSEIFVENLPDQRLIVYEECGHVPQEEIPELSARDALAFLSAPDKDTTTTTLP